MGRLKVKKVKIEEVTECLELNYQERIVLKERLSGVSLYLHSRGLLGSLEIRKLMDTFHIYLDKDNKEETYMRIIHK